MNQKKATAANETAKTSKGVNAISLKGKKQPAGVDAATIYQFRISLLGTEPPIWRRIQVEDCTLDQFHWHIQSAMGWTNSHLHQFKIAGQICGDPAMLDGGWGDFDVMDSALTSLSDILEKRRKRFRFHYEYDFGDGWEHEITFEGRQVRETGVAYPVCLDGERACPPEDCGGVWGFYDMVDALADPENERHEDFLDWCGPFDAEEFDVKKTTKAMHGNG